MTEISRTDIKSIENKNSINSQKSVNREDISNSEFVNMKVGENSEQNLSEISDDFSNYKPIPKEDMASDEELLNIHKDKGFRDKTILQERYYHFETSHFDPIEFKSFNDYPNDYEHFTDDYKQKRMSFCENEILDLFDKHPEHLTGELDMKNFTSTEIDRAEKKLDKAKKELKTIQSNGSSSQEEIDKAKIKVECLELDLSAYHNTINNIIRNTSKDTENTPKEGLNIELGIVPKGKMRFSISYNKGF